LDHRHLQLRPASQPPEQIDFYPAVLSDAVDPGHLYVGARGQPEQTRSRWQWFIAPSHGNGCLATVSPGWFTRFDRTGVLLG